MPVKLTPRSNQEPEARIEIIPLIDIMFFLLASFMLVSLSMVNLKTVKVNLPTASSASSETRNTSWVISVDRSGMTFLEREPVGIHELRTRLLTGQSTQTNLTVLIRGDRDARHGDMMRVLGQVRSAGINRVSFEMGTTTESNPSPR